MAEKEEHKQLKEFLAEYFKENGGIDVEFEKRFEGFGSKKLRPDISLKSPSGTLHWVEIGRLNCHMRDLNIRLKKVKELGYDFFIWCLKKEQNDIPMMKNTGRGLYEFVLNYHHYPREAISKIKIVKAGVKYPEMICFYIHIPEFLKYEEWLNKPRMNSQE